MTPEEKEEVFVFLDGLRETGATNMYGATPYITVTFDIRTPQARELLKE